MTDPLSIAAATGLAERQAASYPTYDPFEPIPTPTWPQANDPFASPTNRPSSSSSSSSSSSRASTSSGSIVYSNAVPTMSLSVVNGFTVAVAIYENSAYTGSSSSTYSPNPAVTSSVPGANGYGYGNGNVNSTGTSTVNANPASPSSTSAPDQSDPGGQLGLTIGLVIGGILLIVSIIVGVVLCRRRRRRKDRQDARVMRERGREDGMGHFEVLESPLESTAGRPGGGTGDEGVGPVGSVGRLVPPRAFGRFLPPSTNPTRWGERDSVSGSSIRDGSTRWEDDSQADMMASDGSTLARTLSTVSTGSVESEGTVRGSGEQEPGGRRRLDHPAYTYMPRRPTVRLNNDTDTAVDPFSDYASALASSNIMAPSPSMTLAHTMTPVSAVPSSAALRTSYPYPRSLTNTNEPPTSEVSRGRDDLRRSSMLSATSNTSAQTARTADTSLTTTTRTTLPEYTYISTTPALTVDTSSYATPSSSPFGDANPFEDPRLPGYEEGGMGRARQGRRVEGMIRRDGPPAYSS